MRWLWLLPLLILVPFGNCQNANTRAPKTEAQQDGFSGPVRSVRMLSDWNSAPWTMSGRGGRAIVQPQSYVFMQVASITCRACDYDREGNRTRSGQLISNGNNKKFVGSEIAIVRDPSGRMIERTVAEAGTGRLMRHDWFGPFGATKSQMYRDGKPTGSRTMTYDSAGRVIEVVGTDAEGNTVDRLTTKYDEEGHWTERADFGRSGELKSLETYDPATDTQHSREFDSSANLKTEFTVAHNQMLSYWTTAEVPGINNGTSTGYLPGSGVYQFRCHENGDCETFRIHYEYLNGDYHLPTAVERRDASGALTDAVYVEYGVDEHHNWTTRKVWVVSPELPERTLCETDARAITYWPE
jgi:hypothetical protein